jgi:hypothetical protein
MQLLDVETVEDPIRLRTVRVVLAVLWACVLAASFAATLRGNSEGRGLAFLAAVALSLGTVLGARLSPDERLAHPIGYRVTALVVLAVAVAGIALAFVPGTSHASKVTAVFFGVVALLAYRCAITRGTRAPLVTTFLATWASVPAAFVAFGIFQCYRHLTWTERWTEHTSLRLMWLLLLLLPLLAIAALTSFHPRGPLPDARVVRGSAASLGQ